MPVRATAAAGIYKTGRHECSSLGVGCEGRGRRGASSFYRSLMLSLAFHCFFINVSISSHTLVRWRSEHLWLRHFPAVSSFPGCSNPSSPSSKAPPAALLNPTGTRACLAPSLVQKNPYYHHTLDFQYRALPSAKPSCKICRIKAARAIASY